MPSTDSFLKRLGYTIVEIVFFAIVTAVFMWAIIYPLLYLTGYEFSDIGDNGRPWLELQLNFIPITLSFIGAIYFTSRIHWFGRGFEQSGLVSGSLIPHTAKGFAWGAGLILVGYIILLSISKLDSQGSDWKSHLFWGYFAMFAIQSFSEEVLSRGFLLPVVGHRFGMLAGLIVSSLIFSVLHFFNPNVNVIGALNIFLAGLAMGILYLRYRNLWYCTGLHWGWNFTQATFLDFNVSGLDMYSFVRFNVGTPTWLTGGDFGLEGSVLSIMMLAAVSWYFARGINWQQPLAAHFNQKEAQLS